MGPSARRLRNRRPATAITAGTVLVTSSAGVTAPGHRGHGAGHGTHGACNDHRAASGSRICGGVYSRIPAQPVIVSERPGPSPSTGRLHFRLRCPFDTLNACCLRCSAAAYCLHLVSTVTVEDRRFSCGQAASSHLVRRLLAGSGWLDWPG